MSKRHNYNAEVEPMIARALAAHKPHGSMFNPNRYQVEPQIGQINIVIDSLADHPNRRVVCTATKENADRIAAALNK